MNLSHFREELLASRPTDLDRVAIWEVQTPWDQNYNRRDTLAYFEGKYKHVVDMALRLPRFITPNHNQTMSMGQIQPIIITPVGEEDSREFSRLLQEEGKLEAELERVRQALRHPQLAGRKP